jgi:hypothetical protein
MRNAPKATQPRPARVALDIVAGLNLNAHEFERIKALYGMTIGCMRMNVAIITEGAPVNLTGYRHFPWRVFRAAHHECCEPAKDD